MYFYEVSHDTLLLVPAKTWPLAYLFQDKEMFELMPLCTWDVKLQTLEDSWS